MTIPVTLLASALVDLSNVDDDVFKAKGEESGLADADLTNVGNTDFYNKGIAAGLSGDPGTIIIPSDVTGRPSDSLGAAGNFVIENTGVGFWGPKIGDSWASSAYHAFASNTPPEIPFPVGRIASWWVSDEADSGQRPYVPNSIASDPALLTLNAAPRRLFSNVAYWAQSGLTITDEVSTAPDGTGQASRITNAGTSWLLEMLPAGAVTLAAGIYTLWASVKWRGTGNANFKIGDHNSGLTTRTATGSWARYHGTFTTVGGSGNFPCLETANAALAVDFDIIDVQLGTGTSDPNPNWMLNSTNTAMQLGVSPSYKAPTVASGAADFSTGNYALIQFPTARTPTAVTVCVLARRISNGDGSSLMPLITKVQHYQDFSALNDISIGPALYMNGTNTLPSPSVSPGTNNGALVDVNGGGWQATIFRYDAAEGVQFLDDFKLETKSVVAGAASFADLQLGIIQDAAHYCGYEIASVDYYERALSNSECVQLSNAVFLKAMASSITRQAQKLIIFPGDSIDAGNSGMSYMFQGNVTSSPHFRGVNIGLSGQRISGNGGGIPAFASAGEITRQTSYLVDLQLAGRVPVICGFIGTNSFGDPGSEYAGNVTGALAALQAWVAAVKAIIPTCKIVLSTMLDRNTSPQSVLWPTDKASFNSQIVSLAGTPGYWDYAINYDTEPLLSTAGGISAANSAVYFDAASKIHPTTAGYALMAPIANAVLNIAGTAA